MWINRDQVGLKTVTVWEFQVHRIEPSGLNVLSLFMKSFMFYIIKAARKCVFLLILAAPVDKDDKGQQSKLSKLFPVKNSF